MEKFDFLFELDAKVAIYVPSTSDVNQADKNDMQGVFVRRLIREFSDMFGGATCTDAIGGWYSQSAGVVVENVKIVYAFCKSADFQRHAAEIVTLAGEIAREMGQEAVTLEYNGKVAFIRP